MPYPAAPVDTEQSLSTTVTAAAVTTTGASAVAAGSRKSILLCNPVTGTPIYVTFGAVATTTNASIVLDATTPWYKLDNYTGSVWAVTGSGSNTLFVTEFK